MNDSCYIFIGGLIIAVLCICKNTQPLDSWFDKGDIALSY